MSLSTRTLKDILLFLITCGWSLEFMCSLRPEALGLLVLELEAVTNHQTWVLGADPESSARPLHALNWWAASPALSSEFSWGTEFTSSYGSCTFSGNFSPISSPFSNSCIIRMGAEYWQRLNAKCSARCLEPFSLSENQCKRCVCLWVCVWRRTYMLTCGGQKTNSLFPLRYHLPCSVRQSVSLGPGPYCLGCASWPEFPGSAISMAWALGS